MPTTLDRVDAYVEAAPPFAQPILRRLRAAFHRACPRLVETIKWGVPHFEHHGILGSMAAFQRHVAFGLWKARLVKAPPGVLAKAGVSNLSALKAATLKDLPPAAVLVDLIRQVARLNEAGVKAPRAPAAKKAPRRVPADLKAALAAAPAAKATFAAFAPSHQREYLEWITEARKPETRARRIAQAVAWMAEGKPRHWRYRRS